MERLTNFLDRLEPMLFLSEITSVLIIDYSLSKV